MGLYNILADNVWQGLQNSLTELINSMWLPLLAIMVALGILFGVLIGWSFWSAGGDEQKIQKAKAQIKWYVIGWFSIFIIAFATPILVEVLKEWVQSGATL